VAKLNARLAVRWGAGRHCGALEARGFRSLDSLVRIDRAVLEDIGAGFILTPPMDQTAARHRNPAGLR
jgi:hypothetical protein